MDGARHHGHQPGRGPLIGGKVPQPLGEASTLDQLHAEVTVPVMAAHLEDRDDVGMVQVGRRLRFLTEPLLILVGHQCPGPKHLEGDQPIQAPLAGSEDDTHPPAGDLLN